MKKYRFKIIGGALFLFIALMLPYVSLLGENDRAITTLQGYFDNIAQKKFGDNKKLCTDEFLASRSDFSDNITQQFSFETALLNHFKVPPNSKYTLKAKKDKIWVPFVGDDILQLSVLIIAQDESDSILKSYLQFGSGEYLPNLVTMKREDGRWKIDGIATEDNEIADSYDKSLKVMGNSSYLSQKGGELVLHEQNIDISTMDPIEKRILTFNLNKVLTLLNGVTE